MVERVLDVLPHAAKKLSLHEVGGQMLNSQQ